MTPLRRSFLRILLIQGTSPHFASDLNRKTELCNRLAIMACVLTWIFATLEMSMGQNAMAAIDCGLGIAFLIPILINHWGHIYASKIFLLILGNFYFFYCSAVQGEQSGIYLGFFVIIGMPAAVLDANGRFRLPLTLLPITLYAWLKWTHFRPFDFLPDYPAPPEFFVAAVFAEFFLCFALMRFIDRTHRNYNARLEELIAELKIEKQKTLEQQEKVIVASKMAALGEMAAGLAHEINNPLAAIQLMSSQILIYDKKNQTPGVEKAATNIQRVVKRISRIIEALQRFAGASDPAAIEQVSMDQIVDETVALCEPRLKNEHISLEIIKDEANTLVWCNANTVSQVLINLLNNAWDSVLDDPLPIGETPRIEISIHGRGQDMAEIMVKDNGPGVPAELRHKIFEPFFTTKPVGRGTGLGLSLSQGLLRSQQGELELCPSEVGACFVLRLPKHRDFTPVQKRN